MAFLRSSFLLRNVLENAAYRAAYFIHRKVELNVVLPVATNRQYATRNNATTGSNDRKAFPLDKKLRYMEDISRRGRFISRQDTDELLQSIKQQSASTSQIVRAFQFYGELLVEETPKERVKLARELWKTLESKSSLDTSHYNAFLSIRVQNEQLISVDEVLEDMKARKLIPNRATFQSIVDSCSRRGDLDGLARTMEVMKAHKVSLNSTMYNSLILAHGLAGQRERALQLVETIKDAGFSHTRETYVTILRVHAKYGDIDAILSEINRLAAEKQNVSDKDILDIIYDLAINGHGNCSVQLFDQLSKDTDGPFVRWACNTVIRLAQKEHDDVALKLLKIIPRKTSESGETLDSGGFFLRQLIKANRPLEKIIAVCKELQEESLHSSPFQVILPQLCSSGSSDFVWSLFRERKSRGEVLVEDNFRPLFNTTNTADIQKSLKTIIQDFDIKPSSRFIHRVILSKLDDQKLNEKLNLLMAANVPPTQAGLGLAFHCLEKKQLKNATDTINHLRLHVPLRSFKPLLISALKSTNDVHNFVLFLRVHFENVSRSRGESNNEETSINEDVDESNAKSSDAKVSINWGSILSDTFVALSENGRSKTIAAILKELVNQGVTISVEEAESIRNRVKASVTSDINVLLDKLASGQLELKPIARPNLKLVSSSSRLEKILLGDSIRDKDSLQKRLMDAYYREGEMDKFEQRIQQFEGESTQVNSLTYARLIDGKVQAKDLDGALEIFKKCKSQIDQFFIFPDTVIQAVSLHIENNKFDEALKFAAETRRHADVEESDSTQAQSRCRELLSRLADEGKVKEVNQLFENLVEHRHIKVTNKLLGALIKVHIVNNDTAEAVKVFETVAQQYKETPLKNVLLKHLITNKELGTLQKVVDICSTVHNEHRVLTDLALSFIECNEREQAERIFEMSNLRPYEPAIEKFTNKCNKDGSIELLENLALATQSSNAIKRDSIFFNILDYYIREDNSDKALEVWVNLQEQNEAPTDAFLIKLGNYLKSKKIALPFQLPDTKVNKENAPRKAEGGAHDFIALLDRKVPSEINKAYHKLPKSELDAVVKKIASGSRQLYRLFNALAEAGNIKGVEKINSLLPAKEQNKIWYKDCQVKAYVQSGKANQWLEEWSKKIEQASTEDELHDLKLFPSDGFYSLLKQNPNLINECENLARKSAEKEILDPINAIWCYKVANGEKESSDKLWTEFIQTKQNINYRPISRKAFEDNNDVLLSDLIKQLQSSETGKLHLDGAYGSLLSIYVRKNQLDDALNIFQILKSNAKNAKAINVQTLKDLRTALKAAGKEIPREVIEAQQ